MGETKNQAGWRMSLKLTFFFLLCLLCMAMAVQPLAARVVKVAKERVNVRQEANTGAKVLDQADKDAIFGWHGGAEDWTKIQLAGGALGYIRNDLLQGYDEIKISGSVVRVRQSPSLQGTILGRVEQGQKLPVLDYQEAWYKVQYNDVTGWVSADYAQLGSPVALAGGQADQTGQAGQTGQATGSMDSATVSTGVSNGVLSGKIITLDPGHGNRSDGGPLDPGAQGKNLGIWEKDVNLDIVLKLKAILESKGATVWLTHTGATSLDLYGRSGVANQNGSDIFVSVHANSSVSPSLSGHSVYFYAPAGHAELGGQRHLRQALAQAIQNGMVRNCGRRDIGVLEANFVVVREADCPAVLVETAFLSNAEEEALLAQGSFRQKLAEGIAQGIVEYFGVA